MLGVGIEGMLISVSGPRQFSVLCTSSVSASFPRRNLWNFVLHLQDPNISDLSLINDLLFLIHRRHFSFRSTIQILHIKVQADFIQRILSPCQTIVGSKMVFILARTSLELLQSLQSSPKCLENASARSYPPVPYQFGPNFFLPEAMTFQTSAICSAVRVFR